MDSVARTPRILELIIAAMALVGILTSGVSNVVSGEHSMLSVWPFLFGYFTIWTNALVILVYGLSWRGGFIRGQTATMIVLVGLVYHFQLSAIHDINDPWQAVGNGLTHYIVPIAVFLDWAAFGPKVDLRWRWALGWLGFSLAYTGFAVVRGALTGVYPYPFLDVVTLGWGGFAASIAGMSVGFLIVGLGMIALRKLIGTRPHDRAAAELS